MKRVAPLVVLLVVGLLVSAAGQARQPHVDESTLPASEKQIPEGDYCKKADVPIGKNETHAHPCSCAYHCTVDQNGNVTETEGEHSPACKAYCSKNGRRCTCHPEEPCDVGAHGNALADMDGTIVAVAAHRGR